MKPKCPTSTDAELLRLVEELAKCEGAKQKHPEELDEPLYDVLFEASWSLRERIAAFRATTIEGIAAKVSACEFAFVNANDDDQKGSFFDLIHSLHRDVGGLTKKLDDERAAALAS